MAHWLKKSKKKKTGNNILSITYFRSMLYIYIKIEDLHVHVKLHVDGYLLF